MVACNPDGLHVCHAVPEAFVVSVDAEEDAGFRGGVETLVGEEPSVFVGGREAAEGWDLREVCLLLEEELVDSKVGIRTRAACKVGEVAGVSDREIPESLGCVGVEE